MQGDFSRWSHDPRDGYRAVLLQQGRLLTDEDWNAQTRIAAHHDEVRSRDVVGPTGGPSDGAGFAIGTGAAPGVAVPWTQLTIGPGRHYVDGVLAEAFDRHLLADQPHLRAVGTAPGLAEPQDDGRYAAVLELRDHQVTGDENPRLLDPALGGVDTTTRQQTVWQVRLVPVEEETVCSELRDPAWLAGLAGPAATLTPSLVETTPDADPCRLTTTGGYRRLENQLYRIQVHAAPDAGAVTLLWSRENGSVVTGLTGLQHVDGTLTRLSVDRVGRDEELSIREGDLVEVTSTDRQLHELPGFLATAGAPLDLVLPVTWSGGRPAGLAALGRAPIVRRWDGPAIDLMPADPPVKLEDGVTVALGPGRLRTGDHWLVPARTVQVAHGLKRRPGTLLWPDDDGVPQALPPNGPVRHRTPLAILRRTGSGWTHESDCRVLVPGLHQLVTIDLVGGDGQEARPGQALAEPVRVVVRNGGLPVPGARVRFTAHSGHPADPDGGIVAVPEGKSNPAATVSASEGVAAATWTLDPAGPPTQTLVARRLDDHGQPLDVAVVATARLSVATEVAWTSDCKRLADADTVAKGLDALVRTTELRLQGGDGQTAPVGGGVLPQPVRVIVDSPCGPVEGATVVARVSHGNAVVVVAEPGSARPDPVVVPAGGDPTRAEAVTGARGEVAFWWQPAFDGTPEPRSDTLQIDLADGAVHAPVVVAAQPAPSGGGGRTPGIHIEEVVFNSGNRLDNDELVKVDELAGGITTTFDAPVLRESFLLPGQPSKPVIRVELELPWPLPGEVEAVWPGLPVVGFRTIVLADTGLDPDGDRKVGWFPTAEAWLRTQLFPGLRETLDWKERPLLGRLIVEGWAIVGAKDPALHVNGHADAEIDGNGRTRLRLPTTDEVTGGRFTLWFWLVG